MCSIGRGLMAEAHIYLVDEPSLGLAPGLAETIVRTLCSLDLGGGALVLAEQNRTLLEGRIDRIVRIHAGKVAGIEPGTPAQGARVIAVLITTVFLASVYALVALGLSLTWAGLGFLNLAHGVTYSAAAVGAYEASMHIDGNALVVLLAGIVCGAIVGLMIYLVVFLPLDGRRNFDLRTLIATLAIALIGENLILDQFGPQPQAFPSLFDWLPTFSIGGTNVTTDQIGAVLAAIVLVTAFVALLGGSRIGLGVRALTQNVEGARLVGIDRRTAALAILVVSGALVGVAAVLLGPVYFVSYNNGLQPMIKGLTVAMLGGLGSVRGTVARRRDRRVRRGHDRDLPRRRPRARLALPADRRRAARAPARARRHPGDDACLRRSTRARRSISPSGPSSLVLAIVLPLAYDDSYVMAELILFGIYFAINLMWSLVLGTAGLYSFATLAFVGAGAYLVRVVLDQPRVAVVGVRALSASPSGRSADCSSRCRPCG